MQQAVLAERPPTTATRSGDQAPGTSANAFVINLVSSTTPVALTRPDHAGLKRFTFFVSRRREEGRERFRLHMGYFDTQEEAERLLDIVRGIYPGAWAGMAPGRGLAAAAAAQPKVREAPATAIPAPVAPVAVVAVSPERATVAPVTPVAPVASSRLDDPAVLALIPDQGRRLPSETPRNHEQQAAAHSLHNIRATIASLDEQAATAPVLHAIPELKPPAVVPTVQPVLAKAPVLSDTGALRVLESDARKSAPAARRVSSTSQKVAAAATRGSTQQQQPRDDKPCYAVQLMWSVQPIAMTQVPQLAIFSAYTLYGAEGNRDGRRWYGLRLGFFTDAVSAKQVAHYVRADFSTVSVVPVTVREREHARLAAGRTTGTAKPDAAAKVLPKAPEFAFIDGAEPLTVKGARPEGAAPPARQIGSIRSTRGAPGKRAKVRTTGRVNANARARPLTLEETLEILGASQLQVDDQPGASINDSGVRHLRLEPAKVKPSKLTRLFERLSERLGN